MMFTFYPFVDTFDLGAAPKNQIQFLKNVKNDCQSKNLVL